MKHLLTSIALVIFGFFSFSQSTERLKCATNDTLRCKVQAAALKASQQILSDTTRRADWDYAYFIILEPQNSTWLDQLSYGSLVNPVIMPQSPDGDFEFVINGIYGQYAKAYRRRFVGGPL